MDQVGDELDELTALLDFEECPEENTRSKCSPTTPNEKSAVNPEKPKIVHDFNIFDKENDCLDEVSNKQLSNKVCNKKSKVSEHEESEIHQGDTDSSDDEGNKYTNDQKYTETGRAIKNLMKKPTTSPTVNSLSISSSWKGNKNVFAPSEAVALLGPPVNRDVYTDPYFGLRIITPLISSQLLNERMAGKTPVVFSRLQSHISSNKEKSNDWVLAGVIVSKFQKTSQKGTTYLCWTLSDLRGDMKTVSLFLFGKANQKLWKTNTHTVVAILNPTPLESRQTSKDIAALSVNNPEQVMVWGTSKDLGTCRSHKKNGEPCTAFVNLNQCEYCIYHLKQEHRKFTARSELQAPSGGGLNQLKNKVLGKNEVFYAGRSYTATVARPTKKQVVKDQKRLKDLFDKCDSRLGPVTESVRAAKTAMSARVQLLKDAERLQKLTGSPATLNSLALEGSTSDDKKACKRFSEKDTTPGIKKRKIEENTLKTPFTRKLKTLCSGTKNLKAEELIKQLPRKEITNEKKSGVSLLSEYSSPKDLRNVNKESIKKRSEEKGDKNGTKLKPTNRVSSISGSNSKTINNKQQPTKNRFENLTKLKSNHSKTIGLSNDKTESHCLKPQELIDVSFEFDDEGTNIKTPELGKAKQMKLSNTNRTGSLFPAPVRDSFFMGRIPCEPEKENVKGNALSTQILRKSPHNKESTSQTKTNNGGAVSSKPQLQDSLEQTKTLTGGPSPQRYKDVMDQSKTLNVGSTPKLQKHAMGQTRTNKGGAVSPTTQSFKGLNAASEVKIENENNTPLNCSRLSAAKLKALRYVKAKGPITKEESNELKRNETKSLMMKRKRSDLEKEDGTPSENNKSSVSKRFLELMNAESKHTDLISNAEDKEMDEYYEKMEKKEKMEEKMLSTFKVECKAVRCLKCNYKAFSASEMCKRDRHPIKVISAVKRFFECQNCQKRTISLDIIPLHNCSGCGTGQWIRTSMLKERKSTTVHLSIRGGEQKFTNSVVTDTNLDLNVPDDS